MFKVDGSESYPLWDFTPGKISLSLNKNITTLTQTNGTITGVQVGNKINYLIIKNASSHATVLYETQSYNKSLYRYSQAL